MRWIYTEVEDDLSNGIILWLRNVGTSREVMTGITKTKGSAHMCWWNRTAVWNLPLSTHQFLDKREQVLMRE